MAFNLADLFEHTADVVPDRTALICGDRSVSFAELDERSTRLGNHLSAQGIGEADHIAIYSLNSIEYVEAMLAAYKVRAVPINVNYRYEDEELVYLFDNADIKAVVYQASFAERIASVQGRVSTLEHLLEIDDGTTPGADTGATKYEDAVAGGDPKRDFGPRDDGDLYILYTGGTTGMPKGVMWRHEDVWRALGGGIDFVTGERITDEHFLAEQAVENQPPTGLVLAPLMHGAAQWGTLGGLFKGTTNVLLPKFDPHAVWSAVETYGIAVVTITGDAMARPLIDENNEPVKPGEIGRLARGGNVPLGYYKDPAKSAETFLIVNGTRHSVPGDLARVEQDGTITVLGRGSQCINSGGEKIYPEEVESVLKAHDSVFDALVIGLDDERWGQKVTALVQPREGAEPTLEELAEFTQSKLAKYKAPRELHLTDKMPRQPSGKPDYKRVRALIESANSTSAK